MMKSHVNIVADEYIELDKNRWEIISLLNNVKSCQMVILQRMR